MFCTLSCDYFEKLEKHAIVNFNAGREVGFTELSLVAKKFKWLVRKLSYVMLGTEVEEFLDGCQIFSLRLSSYQMFLSIYDQV